MFVKSIVDYRLHYRLSSLESGRSLPDKILNFHRNLDLEIGKKFQQQSANHLGQEEQ